jgi:hypothetical protein
MVVIFGSGRLLVWWYDGLIFRSMKWVLDFEAILLSYVL